MSRRARGAAVLCSWQTTVPRPSNPQEIVIPSGELFAGLNALQYRYTVNAEAQNVIGDIETVPRVLMSPEEVIWLDLDHRSGFVLAQIDGVSTYEEIVELTGMDRIESFRILAKLVQDKVIGV